MSCGHGCGHGHYPRYGGESYHGGCWPDEADPRTGWRDQPGRALDNASVVDEMEARLASLHRAIRRAETEIAGLRQGQMSERPGTGSTAEPHDP
jgi:hypothetical protein